VALFFPPAGETAALSKKGHTEEERFVATNAKKPSPDHPHRIAKRKCLRCSTDFMSSWEGERICKRRKDSHVWRGGSTPFDD